MRPNFLALPLLKIMLKRVVQLLHQKLVQVPVRHAIWDSHHHKAHIPTERNLG